MAASNTLVTAFIGLGSNIGDRCAYLQNAVRAISIHKEVALKGVSSVYETSPVGGPPQDDYLNAVIKVETSLEALSLLDLLLEIEAKAGRKREIENGPRVIDLDLLLYGTSVIQEERLTVPHPEMQKRLFVLIPLLEIDENLVHSETGVSFKEYLPGFRERDKDQVIECRSDLNLKRC